MAKRSYGPPEQGHVIKEYHYESGAIVKICDDYMYDANDKEKDDAFYEPLNRVLAPLGYVARRRTN